MVNKSVLKFKSFKDIPSIELVIYFKTAFLHIAHIVITFKTLNKLECSMQNWRQEITASALQKLVLTFCTLIASFTFFCSENWALTYYLDFQQFMTDS